MGAPAFEVSAIRYRYNEVTALDGLSLTIARGQRVVLLGANGSGKSTLLGVLDGLYFPNEGSVLYEGAPLTEERLQEEKFCFEFRRRVGMVFQNPDVQLFLPTVFEEVAFGPLQLRWPREEIRRRASEVLDWLAISHLRDRAPHHLSIGEKKRVSLASVLVLDPEILLLDEPTSALDPKSESRIIDFLVGWRGGAKTVITATHDLDIVEDIADTCYVLDRGRVVEQGVPARILGSTELLECTNLTHAHRHIDGSTEVYLHPHLHRHQH